MFALLTGRKFAPLFWTQFLSAFNDNFLKNALVFLIMFKMAGPGAQSLITLAGGVLSMAVKIRAQMARSAAEAA